MRIDLEDTAVYVRPGATDGRLAARGLSILVSEAMELDALSGSLYVFCNRSRRLLKALYWDGTGFWLMQKRLERPYRFPWPNDGTEARGISAQQLKQLLSGSSFWDACSRFPISLSAEYREEQQ